MTFDPNKPVASSTLSSADIRDNFQHLKNAISKEHNWSDADPNATTHNLNAINITVTASTQGSITTGGSIGLGYHQSTNSVNVLNQATGVAAGTYTLKNLVQELVNKSHIHGTSTLSINCNCDTSGGGG